MREAERRKGGEEMAERRMLRNLPWLYSWRIFASSPGLSNKGRVVLVMRICGQAEEATLVGELAGTGAGDGVDGEFP